MDIENESFKREEDGSFLQNSYNGNSYLKICARLNGCEKN